MNVLLTTKGNCMVNQLAKLSGVLVVMAALSLFPGPLAAQASQSPSAAGAAVKPQAVPSLGSSGLKSANPTSNSDPVGAHVAQRSLPGEHPLASLLGMTLKEAAAVFGPPAQVFPVRGAKVWEDDVAFYYPDHSYLFWFRDRVWEVRVDRRFSGTAIGVRMGDERAEVEKVLGRPFHTGVDSEIFILPNRGFPVRARLFFTAGRLSDLYVYRGDF